jgi:hypothetical protein
MINYINLICICSVGIENLYMLSCVIFVVVMNYLLIKICAEDEYMQM